MGRSVAALFALALAFVGCGGGSDGEETATKKPARAPSPAAALPGFQPVEGPGWTGQVPAPFERQKVNAEEQKAGLVLYAYTPEGGKLPAQLVVGQGPSPGPFDASVRALEAENQLTKADWKASDKRDVDLPGASKARRIESTYKLGDPDTTPIKTIDLVVQREKPSVRYTVLVRAPEADFDKLRLAETIDSFRLR